MELIRSNGSYDPKTAIKNIRTELKNSFPGIKFSVRLADASAVRITYTDGPPTRAVHEVVEKYKCHRFDAMRDIAESMTSDFMRSFGSVNFVSVIRELTEERMEEICREINARYHGQFSDITAEKIRNEGTALLPITFTSAYLEMS